MPTRRGLNPCPPQSRTQPTEPSEAYKVRNSNSISVRRRSALRGLQVPVAASYDERTFKRRQSSTIGSRQTNRQRVALRDCHHTAAWTMSCRLFTIDISNFTKLITTLVCSVISRSNKSNCGQTKKMTKDDICSLIFSLRILFRESRTVFRVQIRPFRSISSRRTFDSVSIFSLFRVDNNLPNSCTTTAAGPNSN